MSTAKPDFRPWYRTCVTGSMTRTLRHILVATDFSPASDAALLYALMLAERFGAAVHLFHVFENPSWIAASHGSERYVPLPSELSEALIGDAKRQLQERLDRFVAAPVDAQIAQQAPTADAISHYAAEHGIDLIVLGAQSHGGAHVVIGSVAERVLRCASCPVLTVREPARTARVRPGDANDPAPFGHQPAPKVRFPWPAPTQPSTPLGY